MKSKEIMNGVQQNQLPRERSVSNNAMQEKNERIFRQEWSGRKAGAATSITNHSLGGLYMLINREAVLFLVSYLSTAVVGVWMLGN